MPMLPDLTAPPQLQAELAELCGAVRQGAGGYGPLLRENVLDVLRCSFPLFGECVGEPALRQLARDFMISHPASRPQFHQLATELVLFAQHREGLSRSQLCLLEYEWTLLATEIDPARVPPAHPGPAMPDEGMVAVNPTLRVVALPFEVQCLATIASPSPYPFVYAIYRAPDHRVMRQPLSGFDGRLLETIGGAAAMTIPMLIDREPPSSHGDLLPWLQHALSAGLIHFVNHTEGNHACIRSHG